MSPIGFLKKINTVLVFVLLAALVAFAAYWIIKSRNPLKTVHVSIDSVRLKAK